ncbi:hypothetical protein [Nocardia sp. NPDC004860]|uniref:hypothetical protein n=1 Tax=Nocardia sp. NPDC004860 TaxID=3154557 RepID=UPI0033BF7810
MLSSGILTAAHASGFRAFVKTVRHAYDLEAVVKGEAGWPRNPADRDLPYFLSEAFRARLVEELPASREHASPGVKRFSLRAKTMLTELAEISVECAQLAHDAGYLPVDEIASRVRVRGRGGIVLQPGIRLLERADDFPADGPILVITDGMIDVLRIRHEHAFLIPAGPALPFRPHGPVFRIR